MRRSLHEVKDYKYTEAICSMLLIFVISVIFIALSMHRRPFCTNDEVLMRSIASGEYTGTPDGHLVYIMAALGWIMALFYNFVPTVQWYDVFIIGLHWFSISAIAFGASRMIFTPRIRWLGAVLAYAILVGIDFSMVVNSTYTVVSAVLLSAGMIFCALAFEENSSEGKRYFAITVILGTFSLLVRKQVFLLGLPIVVILVFYNLRTVKRKEKFVGAIKCSVICGIIVLSCFLVEFVSYNSVDWKEYKKINSNRTALEDYYGVPVFELAEEAYSSVGLDEADYIALKWHNIAFTGDFDVDKSGVLVDVSRKITLENRKAKGFLYVWSRVRRELTENARQPIGMVMLIVSIAIIFRGIVTKKYSAIGAAIAIWIYVLLCCYLFLYIDRFPERVSFGLYFMATMSLVIVYISMRAVDYEHTITNILSWGILGVLIVILIIRFYGIQNYRIEVAERSARENIEMTTELSRYCSYHSDNIYILSSSVGNFLSDRMINSEYSELENMICLSTWMYGSPLYLHKLAANSIGNIAESLLEKDNVYMIQNGDNIEEWLWKYYSKKGVIADIAIVDTIVYGEDRLCVIRVKRN